MNQYKTAFIEAAIKYGALNFGDFVLKSGRKSPYFFNSGAFNSGDSLIKLSEAYASSLKNNNADFDMIFGPSYKGITLASALSIYFSNAYSENYPYAFNRKETKNHGEKGDLLGAPLNGKVVIIDDVISAGTSIRESIKMIKENGATPSAIIIALDRQEKGQSDKNAKKEIESDFSIPIYSIVNIEDVTTYLDYANRRKEMESLIKYRAEYGTSS